MIENVSKGLWKRFRVNVGVKYGVRDYILGRVLGGLKLGLIRRPNCTHSD